MLHRSFKPAKCKTALKLAVSRIKLLNNKRGVQLKQIKRELAQLLESGQVQTARIRVEHVVREEKTLTAYNLVEIYCELIAARLPIIESQKNCPIDLKEAITSVIFATPRCSDVPELADVKKHFTAKYGKEFITSAIELRPDCGVNRMLVEKLSTKSPDGQTKLKILTAIAEEHNVKWDPALFSESDPKPPQDLLNGPNTFEMASKIHTEAPPVPARSNQDDRGGTPNILVPPKRDEKSNVHVNFNAQNMRPSSGSQNFSSSGVSPNNATTYAPFYTEEKSSGTGTEWTEQKQSFPRNENDSSLGRQDWTMQFKDATSAAQAAAESAERASIAARAAAELSRQHSSESPRPYGYSPKNEAPQTYTGSNLQSDRVSKVGENNAFYQSNSGTGHIVDKGREERQHSSESQKSYGYAPKDEEPQVYGGSKFQNDLVSKDAEDKGFHRRNSGTRNENIVEKGQEERAGPSERLFSDGHYNNDRYSSEASLKSSTVSAQDASLVNSFQRVDKYIHRKSSKSFENDFVDELAKKKHSDESQSVVDIHDSKESEEIVYFDDRVTRKQSSTVSRRSHSSPLSDDQEKVLRKNDDVTYSEDTKPEKQPSRASSRSHPSTSADIHEDIFKRNYESEDPFVRDDSSIYRHHSVINSNVNTAFFDDYGSDGDNYKDDMLDYKEEETSVHFSTPVSKSSTNLLDDSAVWSPRRHIDEGLGKSASQSRPSVFSESSEVSSLPSRPDDLPPAAFDNYDSPSSDSEEDLGKSKLTGSTDLHKVPSEKSVQSRRSEPVQSEDGVSEDNNVESWRSPWSRPSVGGSQPKKVLPDRRSQGIKSTPLSEKKFDDDGLPTVQPVSRRMRSRLESTVKDTEELPDTKRDSELLNESTFGNDKELNFGTLTGGLRNKFNRRPPYTRQTSKYTFPVKEATSDTRSDVEQSSSPSPRVMPSIDPSAGNQERYNERASTKLSEEKSSWTFAKHGDSDDYHSEEEAQQETSITKQLHNQKSVTQVGKKSSSKASRTYFDLDDSDSDEDISKSSSPVTARPGAGLSRRTKASFKSGRGYAKTTILSEEAEKTRSSSSSYQDSESLPVYVGRPYSKATVSSGEYVSPNIGVESKSSSSSSNVSETLSKTTGVGYSKTNPSRESVTPSYRAESTSFSSSSHVSETSPKLFTETKSSDQMGTWERRRLVEQNSLKSIPESRRSSHMDSPKSSTTEPKSNYLPKSVESEKSETPSYRAEGKSSSSSSRVSKASPKPLSETKSSDQVGIRERHRLGQKDTPKPTPESNRSSRTDSLKSLTSEQTPKSPPKSVKPEVTETSNSSTVVSEISSKDNASHVHPKLPDSDSFTAFFQSLRQR